jgi:geranylgeranyl reductase family protein
MQPWQVEAGALPAREWDVAIVGGGPAGSLAALHAARGGRSVVLLERGEYPRDKVCGDALIPDALNALRRAGLYDAVRNAALPATRCVLYSPSRAAAAIQAESRMIKRLELDQLLAHAASVSGATIARADVASVTQQDERVVIGIAASPRNVVARTAVLATGAHVSLLRPLGMVQKKEPSAVALRCYVRSRARIDDLLLSFDSSVTPGYAWIFPLPGDEYNVGCGIFDFEGTDGGRRNLRRMFDRFVTQFPPARALFDGASSTSPLKGAPLRCGLQGSTTWLPPNVLAIGEAVGTTFPFNGEGIGKAMETGEIAASLLNEAFAAHDLSRLAEFPRRVGALASKYVGYNIAQRWFSSPLLIDIFIRRARRSRWVSSAFAGIVAETVDPRVMFSVRGMINTMLRR